MSDTNDFDGGSSGLGALSMLGGNVGSPFPQLRAAANALIPPDMNSFGETLDASQQAKAQAIERAIQRLTEAQNNNKAALLASMAGGFLSPTRAGSFGESFGNAMNQAAPQINLLDKQRLEQGNLIDQLRVQQAQLPADSLMKRLSLAGQLNRMSGTATSTAIVQDPNSPTGYSKVITAPGGGEASRISGVAPPNRYNSMDLLQAQNQAIRVVDAQIKDGTFDPATNEEREAKVQQLTQTILGQLGRGASPPPAGPGAAPPAQGAQPGQPPAQNGMPLPPTPPPGGGTSQQGTGENQLPTAAPAAVSTQASPEDIPAILRPLPARNTRVPPAVMKQLEDMSKESVAASNSLTLVQQLRDLNQYTYYPDAAGAAAQTLGIGKPSNASIAPETSAQVRQLLGLGNANTDATLEYPKLSKQLAAMAAKPMFGSRVTNFDLKTMQEIESLPSQPPQVRENLLARSAWYFEQQRAWKDLASSYVAQQKEPPSFEKWDEAYRTLHPFPASVMRGNPTRNTIEVNPATPQPTTAASAPGNPTQTIPRAPGSDWFERLTPQEQELLRQSARRNGRPRTAEEEQLLAKIKRLQAGETP